MRLFGRSNRDRLDDQGDDSWLGAALKVREVDRPAYQFEPKPTDLIEAAQRNAEWTRPVESEVRAPASALDRVLTRPVEPEVRAAPASALDRAVSVPWSSEPPTQPGAYWWRIRGLDPRVVEAVTPHLCLVVLFGGRLCIHQRGADSSKFIGVAALAREWAGPLAKPEDLQLKDLEIA